MRRLCCLAALLVGCAQTQATPVEMVPALQASAPSFENLDAAAQRAPARNPLLIKETGLAGVSLGASPQAVEAVLGKPDTQEGGWWTYRPSAPAAFLRLDFDHDKLRQIQAWPPGDEETSTMVRLLDNARRVVRKYGPAPVVLPWGSSEGWLYRAADVAFVVTPPDAQGDRAVVAIIVGL